MCSLVPPQHRATEPREQTAETTCRDVMSWYGLQPGSVMAQVSSLDSPSPATLASLTRCSRWRSGPCPAGGCCWPAAARMARCGCGTRPPPPRSASPRRPHRAGVRGGVRVPCPAGGCCWPAPASMARCGCGTRPPPPGRRAPHRPHRKRAPGGHRRPARGGGVRRPARRAVLLASGGDDGTVRLWDPVKSTAAPLHTYSLSSDVYALCFDRTTLFVGCSDGLIALNVTTDDPDLTTRGGVAP